MITERYDTHGWLASLDTINRKGVHKPICAGSILDMGPINHLFLVVLTTSGCARQMETGLEKVMKAEEDDGYYVVFPIKKQNGEITYFSITQRAKAIWHPSQKQNDVGIILVPVSRNMQELLPSIKRISLPIPNSAFDNGYFAHLLRSEEYQQGNQLSDKIRRVFKTDKNWPDGVYESNDTLKPLGKEECTTEMAKVSLRKGFPATWTCIRHESAKTADKGSPYYSKENGRKQFTLNAIKSGDFGQDGANLINIEHNVKWIEKTVCEHVNEMESYELNYNSRKARPVCKK